MEQFIQIVEKVNNTLNNFIWGPVMIILLLGTGIYFSIRTNFLQIRKFGFIMRKTFLSIFKKKEISDGKSISPFQALTTALAATVGTGNIIGVATAISIGGPGAIFWLWVCAFFGMLTKYAEVTLAIKYREKNSKGEWVGGPMYYIQNGLHIKWLSIIFCIFGFLASFGIGNMTQVNAISTAMLNSLNIPTMVTGLVLAGLTALVILGGVKRIAQATEKVVPFMSLFYILAALIVIIVNIKNIPATFGSIFKYAFQPTAQIGGFAGATLMLTIQKGMSRGIFSNEAGLGSAPIAHAIADTDHPVSQAMWGIFEVFVDSIIVCTLTGLVIISSGVWSNGTDGSDLAIAAFSTGIGSIAPIIISVSIFFFAFSTIISWSYYGEKCLEYIAGTSKYNIIYKLIFIVIIVVGAVTEAKLVWNISDTLNGFMAIPNLIALLALSGVVIKLTKEYFNDPQRLK